MAGFGRSNSLSINTGGGGLFGNNANQAQASTQPQSSGGLFGSSTAAQPQPQAQGSGGFGGALKLSTPATSSGGLFGASTTQPQAQTQNTVQSGGLFGGASQAKPSLFAPSTQQTIAGGIASTPSLFGNTNTQQPQQQQTTALPLAGTNFQPQQQQPQQQQNSLFGGMNTQSRSGTLGGTTLVASQMGASTQQPVQLTLESMRGTTRFNDLHPELQALIQQFDQGIQQKINYCNQIHETLPESEKRVATIAPDVAYIESFLSTVEAGLENDSANVAHLKEVVKKDAADATLSFRAIENQRLPAQFHYRNSTNLTGSSAKTPAAGALDDDDPTKPVDLMGYFNRRTDDLGRTLQVYQRQINEITAHLKTMEAGTLEKAQQLTSSRSAPRDQRRELVAALKAIEGAILDLAKKVGQVRDEVTKQTLGSVGAALL
ncbi:hypothetical protein GQ44DRAFT_608904 [Phaeosphaeriaceae sp. PMI808]|nr:hypothetical protein GQ44DRAFT_608904 [Phaeosphaeriaceae sp. PMI808]